MKVPPSMGGVDNYETWKNDLEMWSELTDLEPEKRAFAVHLVLEGAARIASGELGKAVYLKMIPNWFYQVLKRYPLIV